MSDLGTIRHYLLGTASPEQRVDLENRYLSDPSLFEELTEVENDLIDSYARGKLSDPDRQLFEQQYLTSPQRRARVQFASALHEISREHESAAPPQELSLWRRLTFAFSLQSRKLRWGMAMAAVALILVMGWLTMPQKRNLRATLRPAKGSGTFPSAAAPVSNGQAPSGGNTVATEVAKAERPELEEFTVQLTPGVARGLGAETTTFSVPKTPWIQFRLVLENDDYRSYSAIVETAEGNEVRRVDGLKSQLLHGNKIVDVSVPSKILKPGDYVIRLSETPTIQSNQEDIAVYSFRALSR
jgi:hypothetical protein